ncbi:MAG: DUF4147 domain-containing protein [bacterium]|nr:DUF4147 domain-containing protein [bacterium]
MKDALRSWFLATLAELDAERCTRDWLASRGQTEFGAAPLLVLAIGKAALPMARAVTDVWPPDRLRGLVVPPHAMAANLPALDTIPGGHPLPDRGSLTAGARALELARGVGRDEIVLCLLSGGGSAMCELPADPAVTLAELRTFHERLVGCGAPIVAMNTVRRWLSACKGGRLALAAGNALALHTLAISDVPDDAAAALASGPTVPEPSSIADCHAVIEEYGLRAAVPSRLRDRLDHGGLPAPLRGTDPIAQRSEFTVLASNRDARRVLQRHAEAAGLLVEVDQSVDDEPYDRAAGQLIEHLERMHSRHPERPVAILAGGELSVRLPAAPGIGGRNQQFALECARRIAGRPITVLSAGTDGIDGTSPAAGAIVDGDTATAATAAGCDIENHLERCDAHPLLARLDATVATGPTGQNLRDLRLLVHAGNP